MIGPPQFNRAGASPGLTDPTPPDEIASLSIPETYELPPPGKARAPVEVVPEPVVVAQADPVPEVLPEVSAPVVVAEVPAVAPVMVPAEKETPLYVSLGPDYFDAPEVQPYTVSVADIPPAAPGFALASALAPDVTPLPRAAERGQLAAQPENKAPPEIRYTMAAELVPPALPDQPLPPGPQETPPILPSRIVAMLTPPRPDSDPVLGEDNFSENAGPEPKSPKISMISDLPAPRQAEPKAPPAPDLPGLKAKQIRVKVAAPRAMQAPRIVSLPQPELTDMAALSAPAVPGIERHDTPAPKPAGSAPLPPKPPVPEDAGPAPFIVTKEPELTPERPGGCFVNRGSNDRMVLICDGSDVSQNQVFRAVIEGESAFRGLRDFDGMDQILNVYGFNPARYSAMTQGPRTATDVSFLRELRSSGSSLRVKGRPFDLFLLKGDKGVATILVEQAAAPARANPQLSH